MLASCTHFSLSDFRKLSLLTCRQIGCILERQACFNSESSLDKLFGLCCTLGISLKISTHGISSPPCTKSSEYSMLNLIHDRQPTRLSIGTKSKQRRSSLERGLQLFHLSVLPQRKHQPDCLLPPCTTILLQEQHPRCLCTCRYGSPHHRLNRKRHSICYVSTIHKNFLDT